MRKRIRIGRRDENRSRNLIRIKAVVNPHMKSRGSRPHKHVRRRDIRGVQKLMQIIRDSPERTRRRPRLAPSICRAVIPARVCKFRDLRLYFNPAVTRSVTSAVEYDRRTPFTRAKDVQRAPANINRPANLWIPLSILSPADLLVDNTRYREHNNQQKQRFCDRDHPSLR